MNKYGKCSLFNYYTMSMS